MSHTIFNMRLHTSGGRFVPYDRYHLTEDQWRAISRYADYSRNGMMPAGIKDYIEWVDVPEYSWSYGKKGQKARDADYLYICVSDNTWKRTPLEDTF